MALRRGPLEPELRPPPGSRHTFTFQVAQSEIPLRYPFASQRSLPVVEGAAATVRAHAEAVEVGVAAVVLGEGVAKGSRAVQPPEAPPQIGPHIRPIPVGECKAVGRFVLARPSSLLIQPAGTTRIPAYAATVLIARAQVVSGTNMLGPRREGPQLDDPAPRFGVWSPPPERKAVAEAEARIRIAGGGAFTQDRSRLHRAHTTAKAGMGQGRVACPPTASTS